MQNSSWTLYYPVQAKLHAAPCDQVNNDNIWNTSWIQPHTTNNDQIITNHMCWMTVPNRQQEYLWVRAASVKINTIIAQISNCHVLCTCILCIISWMWFIFQDHIWTLLLWTKCSNIKIITKYLMNYSIIFSHYFTASCMQKCKNDHPQQAALSLRPDHHWLKSEDKWIVASETQSADLLQTWKQEMAAPLMFPRWILNRLASAAPHHPEVLPSY